MFFQLVESGVNDRLYIRYSCFSNTNYSIYSPLQTHYVYITLPYGGYNCNYILNGETISGGAYLAYEIQTLMNAAINSDHSIRFTCDWNAASFSISISCFDSKSITPNYTSFKFLTDVEAGIVNKEWGDNFDPNKTASANSIFKIDIPMRDTQNYSSDFINLQAINNIYITSPNLGSFDTISSFSNNVIKKVPVSVPYGYVIIDQNSSNNDFLNCSKQVLRTIEFHLKDSRGNFIKMHGMNCSFSIVFNKFNLTD